MTVLPRGSATGIGSLPGRDPFEAARIVAGELAGFPHLAETPGRGPGAALPGRVAALLVDIPLELAAGRWTVAGRPGADRARAAELLEEDLLALAATLGLHRGPLKVAVPGPITTLAGVDGSRGQLLLADVGARREVTASLAAGTAAFLDRCRSAVPGADLILQIDEPSLPAALAGRIRTASGWGAWPAMEPAETTAHLQALTALAPTVVHCCAPAAPVRLLRQAGAAGVSLPIETVAEAQAEELGELLESGGWLFAGVCDPLSARSAGAELSDPAATVAPVRRLLSRLGIAAPAVLDSLVLTPDCGLAGTPTDRVVPLLAGVRDAAERFAADPEAL